MSAQKIKCAKCNVAIQSPADPQPDSVLACPVCGESDTFDGVMREIRDQVGRHVMHAATAPLRELARTNKAFKFTERDGPEKPHRFVVDLEPLS